MHILMHENYPVAKIIIDKETGSIVKIKDIFDTTRIPVGVHIGKAYRGYYTKGKEKET